MKKKNQLKLKLVTLCFIMFLTKNISSQTSTTGHFVPGFPALNWCGWDAATPIPLNIEHRGNQLITFSTNGFMRMSIDNGSGLNAGGRISIGNNLPVGFAPTARVHIHQNGASGFPQNNTPQMRFTTNVTNVTATDGFVIGNQTFNPLLNQPSIGYLINYEPSAPVAFYTDNTAVAGGAPVERMRVNAFNFNGFVGVGNTTTFNATAQMHVNVLGLNTGGLGFAGYSKLLRTDGDSTHSNQWELYTGTTNANLVPKYRVSTSTPNANNNQGADVYQEAVQGDMIFKVNGKRLGSPGFGNMPPNSVLASNGSYEAMRISKVKDLYLQKNEGRVSISMDTTINGKMIRNPRAMLHIGEVSSGGWRPWMNVGTFYDYGTDCMYTGVRSLNPGNFDDNEAVVVWGNNPNSGSGFNNDRLRFIFTAAGITQNGTAGLVDGLETMRIVADTGTSKVGIGNFFATNTNPANMLEIKSDAKCPYFVTGNASGLRFKNLKSTSAIVANGVNGVNNLKLLTVDVNGDVVLTNAAGGGPGGGVNTAQNGLTLLNPTVAELGGPAGSAAAAQLLNNREIPMNNKQLLFTQNGNIRIGQILSAFPAGTLPTFNIDNSVNTTNNVSALIYDFCPNAVTNRKGMDIKMNLNSTPSDVIALNVEHLNNSLAQGDVQLSRLISAKGLDWNNNSIQDDEVFGVSSAGYSGFGLDPTYYGAATLGIGDYNGSSAKTTPITGHYGRHSLFVYNNKDNGQNVRNADFYAEGNQYIDGVISTAKVNGPFSGVAIGGLAYGNTNSQQAFSQNIAIYGNSQSAANGINAGGYFIAGNSTAQNYGIYAQSSTGPNDYAAYFSGNVFVNGIGTGNAGQFYSSDQSLKTNINPITNAKQLINQLQPKSFYFDTTNAYGLKFSPKKQYGLIAQDVQLILPELVNTQIKPAVKDSLGTIITQAKTYKTLNYNAFIGILLANAKLQQNTIDSLKKKDSLQTAQIAQILTAINTLSNAVTSCCSNSVARSTSIIGNQTDVELSDKNAIVLNQNVPNPFAENTIITYNIPVDFKVAQIIFNAMDGRIIKAVDINQKGKGQINVYANDLTNGLYSYYLVVDGKVIDTKKLIKQN